jgi:hypothetical protein
MISTNGIATIKVATQISDSMNHKVSRFMALDRASGAGARIDLYQRAKSKIERQADGVGVATVMRPSLIGRSRLVLSIVEKDC